MVMTKVTRRPHTQCRVDAFGDPEKRADSQELG